MQDCDCSDKRKCVNHKIKWTESSIIAGIIAVAKATRNRHHSSGKGHKKQQVKTILQQLLHHSCYAIHPIQFPNSISSQPNLTVRWMFALDCEIRTPPNQTQFLSYCNKAWCKPHRTTMAAGRWLLKMSRTRIVAIAPAHNGKYIYIDTLLHAYNSLKWEVHTMIKKQCMLHFNIPHCTLHFSHLHFQRVAFAGVDGVLRPRYTWEMCSRGTTYMLFDLHVWW